MKVKDLSSGGLESTFDINISVFETMADSIVDQDDEEKLTGDDAVSDKP